MKFYEYRMILPLRGDSSRRDRAYSREIIQWGEIYRSATGASKIEAWCRIRMLKKEHEWLSLGSPYYKVPPEMIPVMSRTTLHIPSHAIRAPFPSFVVRFAEAYPLLDSTHQDRSATCLMVSMETLKEGDALSVYFSYPGETSGFIGEEITFPLYRGKTIEEEIGDLERWSSIGAIPDNCRDKERLIMRIAITVCMIATTNSEFLSPDLLSRDQEKVNGTETSDRIKELHEKAKRRGKYGWYIGHEQSLPRDHREYVGTGTPTGRHLSYSHFRSGHFAAIRCGAGLQQVKLVWRKMTVVKPELPPNPNASKGYRISV
jgi:hypothetical protein